MNDLNDLPFGMLLLQSPLSLKSKSFRSTHIIATISSDVKSDEFARMVDAGMNIACFKLSNGKEDLKNIESTLATFKKAIKNFNEMKLSQSTNGIQSSFQIATAIDLRGSYFETGIYTSEENKDIKLIESNIIKLTTNSRFKEVINDEWIYVNCSRLLTLKPNQIIILNKTIRLVVESAEVEFNLTFLKCRILNSGVLKLKEVPVEVNITGMSPNFGVPEDIQEIIKFCQDQSVDFLIVSINDPESLSIIKILLDAIPVLLQIIVKLEDEEAIRNVDEIIKIADGVMLPRARLQRNMSSGKITQHQKNILRKCLIKGVPTIIASYILTSRKTDDNCGTQAEIDDIFSIVLDGTDCIMLNQSLSNSSTIKVLHKIIKKAEEAIDYQSCYWKFLNQSTLPSPIQSYDFTGVVANLACTAATESEANAIIVLTENGKNVRLISKLHPGCPIIAVTSSLAVARYCCLFRGVFSIQQSNQKLTIDRIEAGIDLCALFTDEKPGVVVAVVGQKSNEKSDSIQIISMKNGLIDDSEKASLLVTTV